MKTVRDRCIALAGMFQAADLVHGIAHTGSYDEESVRACIYSLFQVDAESVPAVYGGLEGIAPGLDKLVSQLTGDAKRSTETTGYVISMMYLEKKLSKQPEMLNLLSNGIHVATSRLAHFPMLHQNILGQLAELYTETISTLLPRIIVHGDPMHLQNRDNVNIIRSLLLAGIRSAMLWHQCGGSRLQIVLQRQKIVANALELMDEIKRSRH